MLYWRFEKNFIILVWNTLKSKTPLLSPSLSKLNNFCCSNWNNKFRDTHLKRTNKNSVFPGYSVDERQSSFLEKPDISGFKLNDLTWLSFGTMICEMYEKFEGQIAISYDFILDDFLIKSETEIKVSSSLSNGHKSEMDVPNENEDVRPATGTESKENSNSADVIFLVPSTGENQTSADASAAEDSDAGASKVTDSVQENTKPRQGRRRGSDLSFLEQWGWHKNKRYVQRKKSLDRNDPDTTVNGVLRKMLAKYFE